MIPYLQIQSLSLFGLTFDAFGFLVASGFIVGAHLAARRARQVGLSVSAIYDTAILSLIFGFVGAHLFHLAAYRPQLFWKEPWQIFYIWSGLSSFGGFLGASMAIAVYFHRKKLSFFSYADTTMFGLLPGWMLGRIGCFTAHDHPGALTHFFLAVKYPGGSRHDLGLYEALVLGMLSCLVYYLNRNKKRTQGFIFSVAILCYGGARFFLDFLRARDLPLSDPRYLGLTPAQYLSVAFVVLGGYRIVKNRERKKLEDKHAN